jgi:hypothetical protein
MYDPAVLSVRDWIQVAGLTPDEGVALMARPTGETFSNQFFIDLKAGTGDFSAAEMALTEDEFMPIVDKYAGDDMMFKEMFAQAWTKMMTADRFDGPMTNPCDGIDDLGRFDDAPTTGTDAPNGSSAGAKVSMMAASSTAVVVVAFSLL